eukprot:6028548-Ditylum_brightwellii.AAC.1
MKIEAAITMESTFASKEEREKWFDTHSLKDPDDKRDYDLYKVPTISCKQKFASFLAKRLFLAFSPNPPARFMTKGTNLRFVPETGVMVLYAENRKQSFPAFLTGTDKVQTTPSVKAMLAGFFSSSFFCPLSEDETSPFYISPFTLASQMPRSGKDPLHAFHQIGKVEKQTKLYGICTPALK